MTLKEYKAAWYQRNKVRQLELQKARRALLPKKPKVKRIARGKDPVKRKEACRRYYLRHKELITQRNLAWRLKNPEVQTAILAKRRATKLRATPVWANQFFMKEAYHLARLRTKSLGFKWEVDHVVPLQSDIVCGLHCEQNLQVISRIENVKKGNKFWPDMPDGLAS